MPATSIPAPSLGISPTRSLAARRIRFADEDDLVRRLRPDRDGLILQDGDRRSLFLPSVWERVPRPAHFLRQLKRKAGLPADHRSDSLRVFRYSAESFSAPFRAG